MIILRQNVLKEKLQGSTWQCLVHILRYIDKNEDLNHYTMWTKHYVTMENKNGFIARRRLIILFCK